MQGQKAEVPNSRPQLRARGEITSGPKRAEMLPHPCLLGGPKQGGNATPPLHSRSSPTPSAGSTKSEVVPTKGNKIRSGCLTPTFLGPQKRAEMLCHPCLLGGPKEGGNAMPLLHSRGSPTPSAGSKKTEVVPNKGEQKQKWLPHPCLLGGENVSSVQKNCLVV